MITHVVNRDIFKFKYLPDYADFLLKNKLTEFVTVGIRFCREVDLPLLKPLSRFSEQELVDLSLESNKAMLTFLSKNETAHYIEENVKKWEANTITAIDKEDVVAEDLTLGFFLRRKIFAYFLDSFTKNLVEQKFIIAEIDIYTTQEELISYSLYIKTQQEKLALANRNLNFHRELLLEAQELGGVGSFLMNFKDNTKDVFTPEYKKIFEIEGAVDFGTFLESVHPDDRAALVANTTATYTGGGNFEMEYRYKKTGNEKRIWSKGFVISEEGKPVLIRGIVKDITNG